MKKKKMRSSQAPLNCFKERLQFLPRTLNEASFEVRIGSLTLKQRVKARECEAVLIRTLLLFVTLYTLIWSRDERKERKRGEERRKNKNGIGSK